MNEFTHEELRASGAEFRRKGKDFIAQQLLSAAATIERLQANADPSQVTVDRAKLLALIAGYAKLVRCDTCQADMPCRHAGTHSTWRDCRAALCAAFGLEVPA